MKVTAIIDIASATLEVVPDFCLDRKVSVFGTATGLLLFLLRRMSGKLKPDMGIGPKVAVLVSVCRFAPCMSCINPGEANAEKPNLVGRLLNDSPDPGKLICLASCRGRARTNASMCMQDWEYKVPTSPLEKSQKVLLQI
jgi:hypothetical protein